MFVAIENTSASIPIGFTISSRGILIASSRSKLSACQLETQVVQIDPMQTNSTPKRQSVAGTLIIGNLERTGHIIRSPLMMTMPAFF